MKKAESPSQSGLVNPYIPKYPKKKPVTLAAWAYRWPNA